MNEGHERRFSDALNLWVIAAHYLLYSSYPSVTPLGIQTCHVLCLMQCTGFLIFGTGHPVRCMIRRKNGVLY